MRAVHARLGFAIPVDYAPAADNDTEVAGLPDASVVVNATGLGKDRPGSPLGAAARFPRDGIAWDFNYRGELVFLEQARAASVRAVDGWHYFIHGWTRVIAEVFAIDIPTAGPEFERLSEIAKEQS